MTNQPPTRRGLLERADRAVEVARLRQRGVAFADIADRLGISNSTARRLAEEAADTVRSGDGVDPESPLGVAVPSIPRFSLEAAQLLGEVVAAHRSAIATLHDPLLNESVRFLLARRADNDSAAVGAVRAAVDLGRARASAASALMTSVERAAEAGLVRTPREAVRQLDVSQVIEGVARLVLDLEEGRLPVSGAMGRLEEIAGAPSVGSGKAPAAAGAVAV